jgi:hypothetical protein
LGTSISGTDLNRKVAFAKDHEPQLAAVGAGQDFQAKLETKLRALESDSGAERMAPPSPACPTTTAPSAKPKAASTSS